MFFATTIEMGEPTGVLLLYSAMQRVPWFCRSTWSNKYYPEEEEEGFLPSPKLRAMEIEANKVFDAYRKL